MLVDIIRFNSVIIRCSIALMHLNARLTLLTSVLYSASLYYWQHRPMKIRKLLEIEIWGSCRSVKNLLGETILPNFFVQIMGLFKYDVSLEEKRGFLSHVIFFAIQGQIDLSPDNGGRRSNFFFGGWHHIWMVPNCGSKYIANWIMYKMQTRNLQIRI